MPRILAICGSLQARSGNRALLETAAAEAPAGVDVVLFEGLRDLPHFDPDLERDGAEAPPPVQALRKAIADSDALLIASPEYGMSLPGSLKNAIDWLIGSGELERKIVGVTASVSSPERGRRGLAALLEPLGAVRARIVGGAPIVRGPAFARDVRELVAAVADRIAREGAAPPPD